MNVRSSLLIYRWEAASLYQFQFFFVVSNKCTTTIIKKMCAQVGDVQRAIPVLDVDAVA